MVCITSSWFLVCSLTLICYCYCCLAGKCFEYVGRILHSDKAYEISKQYYDFVLTLFPKEVHALLGKARILTSTVTTQNLQQSCILLLTVLEASSTCEQAIKLLCGTSIHEAAFKGQGTQRKKQCKNSKQIFL